MKIYETLLLFALVCALAAVFVLWAKWEEEKVKTKEERDRRFDEISRALSIEKELEQENQYFHFADAESIANYQYAQEERRKRKELQDKLSALLCPHNDHVWKDGCCVKCGRVKDAEIH